MSVIVKKMSGVVLWLLEAVLWVFVVKALESGWKWGKSLKPARPQSLKA